MVQGREFDFPKGSIVAFDKGYVDYEWFKSLTDKGVFFVTRVRARSVYKVLERKSVNPGSRHHQRSGHSIEQRSCA